MKKIEPNNKKNKRKEAKENLYERPMLTKYKNISKVYAGFPSASSTST